MRQDIIATLKYGKLRGIRSYIFYGLLVFLMFFVVWISDITNTFAQRLIMIVAYLISILMMIAYFVAVIQNEVVKRKLMKWLEDAIQLKAYTEGIEHPIQTRYTAGIMKLKISFKYEGKLIKKYSGSNEDIYSNNGYDRIFNQFADKEINILYSPKYDEVILLNPNC